LEYLGLHNKSRAEVHPGHEMTDPKEEEEECRVCEGNRETPKSRLKKSIAMKYKAKKNCRRNAKFKLHIFLRTIMTNYFRR
jgi:hypothetical protein